MSSHLSITLYDVPSTLPEKTSSFNVWKTKVLLHYKNIPYVTEWINFQDVERVCKQVGAPPTRNKPDGRPLYTIPFITVESELNGSVLAISDSAKIAAYIERTFPDPERTLIPKGTEAFHAMFEQYCLEKLLYPLIPVLVKPFIDTLESPEWYAQTREEVLGKTVEQVVATTDEAVEATWKQAESGLDNLALILDANVGTDATPDEEAGRKARVMGDRQSYADILLLTILFFVIQFSKDDGWKRLKDRNEGRWGRPVDSFRDYLPPF